MLFTTLMRYGYTWGLKPVLFRMDPELVHDEHTRAGMFLGKYRPTKQLVKHLFRYDDSRLQQTLWGVDFCNPVGLSAGFDYNGKLPAILGEVGFGFESVGTVTNLPYAGNQKPRLGRLPKSRGLLVNKGFKSEGMDMVIQRLVVPDTFRVGLSVGVTNSPKTATPDTQIADIIKAFTKLMKAQQYTRLAYVELNISCPNVMGSGSLAEPKHLEEVLGELGKLNLNKPLLIKFPIEIEWKKAKRLIEIMIEHGVVGVIIGNLLKNRQGPTVDQKEMVQISKLKGNISGKPTESFSNSLIEKVYQEFGDRITIIGVGGIFSAEDAYTKIRKGASLVQLITGMIYEGPQLIGEVNRGLVRLLTKDGFSTIQEAVGADFRSLA